MLRQYEQVCVHIGYDRSTVKGRVRRYAEAMQEANVRVPRAMEKRILAAIYADRKAEKELQYFSKKRDYPEWAQIVRLGMWASAQGKHPSLRDHEMELLVPRDKILSALRYAKGDGVSDVELSKLSTRSWLLELRQEKGIKLRRFPDVQGWRTVLEREPRPRRLRKQSDVFREIRERIELLGNPAPLEEAHRYVSATSRTLRFIERDDANSALNDFARVMEDEFLRVAGSHLKRMAYLMAVAQKVVKGDPRATLYLAGQLFERLNKRQQRQKVGHKLY
jgi:hypothetical protein